MGIRVLVAEGSATLARTIAEALGGAPGVAVIGFAHDGVDAIRRAQDLRPDVLLLSLDIPRGDGARVLRELMQSMPVATVMLTPESGDSAGLDRMLTQLGAVACVPKPDLSDARNVRERLQSRLLPVVRSAGRMKVVRMVGGGTPPESFSTPLGNRTPTPQLASSTPLPPSSRVVLIGSSTGGPEALRAVLRGIPAEFDLPIVIAQHMPEGFTKDFARVLAGETRLRVVEATEGDVIAASTVYVGVGGSHLRITRGGRLAIERPATRSDNCPSVDILFNSGASVFGAGTLAVVLTGMGIDGESGVRVVRQFGGRTIAQDESTSRIYGMPAAAVSTGCVDVVLPLPMIGAEIGRHGAGATRP